MFLRAPFSFISFSSRTNRFQIAPASCEGGVVVIHIVSSNSITDYGSAQIREIFCCNLKIGKYFLAPPKRTWATPLLFSAVIFREYENSCLIWSQRVETYDTRHFEAGKVHLKLLNIKCFLLLWFTCKNNWLQNAKEPVGCNTSGYPPSPLVFYCR